MMDGQGGEGKDLALIVARNRPVRGRFDPSTSSGQRFGFRLLASQPFAQRGTPQISTGDNVGRELVGFSPLG